MDKDIRDNMYLASGALIDNEKVLTARDFLELYEKNIENRNLFVHPAICKSNNDQITKVVEVHVDHMGSSQLAVAKVSSFT